MSEVRCTYTGVPWPGSPSGTIILTECRPPIDQTLGIGEVIGIALGVMLLVALLRLYLKQRVNMKRIEAVLKDLNSAKENAAGAFTREPK